MICEILLGRPTMRPCDFAPYHSNLGPANFSLCSVDECDFLAKIETNDGQIDQQEKQLPGIR